MNTPERLTKEEARARLIAIDADPDAIDWDNVRAELTGAEAEAAAHPDLAKGLPVEKTLAILRAHVAYLDAASEMAGRDVTHIAPPPGKSTTGGDARAALLDAAYAALAALKRCEAAMAEHESADIGTDLAMPLSFLRATVRGAIGMIEGRLPLVERTPETVLRAMERACGLASVDAWRAFYQAQRAQCRAGTAEAAQAVRVAHAEGTAADLRHAFVGAELARCLEDGPDYEATVVEPMASDYLRRLDGSTPLDAPPLG